MASQYKDDSEKKPGRLSKFSKKVRDTTFEVLFILLKEEETSVWLLILMRLIDFMQLMVFPFNGDAQFPWHATNFFVSLQNAVEAFQIISYLSNFPWATYLAVFYIGIFLVLLVIVDIVYVLFSIARKKFTFIWPLKALTAFCSIFVTVLFLPLLSTPSSTQQ
ncbi:MAG: hypothetical protein P4M11_00065 [Candidatus Pacebacteria bacterium]|nr:hypothetical protein [Candidatus Paceibacterota bacterium]